MFSNKNNVVYKKRVKNDNML